VGIGTAIIAVPVKAVNHQARCEAPCADHKSCSGSPQRDDFSCNHHFRSGIMFASAQRKRRVFVVRPA
jgi:hypothetical protein